MADEDVNLSLGFDTSDVVAGGDVYVQTASRIQDAAVKTAAVNKQSVEQMSRDQLLALRAQEQQQRQSDAQLDVIRKVRMAADAEAQEESIRRAALASGQLAKEYIQGLQTQFKLADAQIKAAVASGLMNPAQAKEAARQNALAYNAELSSAIGESGGLFQSVGAENQAATLAAAASSMKSVTVASEAAGLGLGRLRYSFVSLAASASGIPPIVGRVVASFGSMALGLAPLLALLGAIIAMAEAWKYVEQPQKDAKDAIDKYNESAKDAYNDTVALTVALGRLSQIKLGEPTAELSALHTEVKKLTDDLSGEHGLHTLMSELQMMGRDMFGGSTQSAMLFEAQVGHLNDLYKTGHISIQQYTQDLIDLAKRNPDMQDLAAKFLNQAGALQGVIDKVNALKAVYDQTNAQQKESITLYGDPALATVGQKLYDVGQQLRAVGAGGQVALKSVQDTQKTLSEAATAWAKYVEEPENATRTFKGITLAHFTYNDAVKQGIPEVAQFTQAQANLAAAEVKLAAGIKASNEAKAEAKRIAEETKTRTVTVDATAADRDAALEDQQKLTDAVQKGNDAFARADAQMKIDAEVRKAVEQVTKELTDTKTGELLVSAQELEARVSNAEATIRETEATKALNNEIKANNATAQAIQGQLALASAYDSGAMAVKDEAIELKYLQDLQKANSMTDDGQRQRAEDLAAQARDAAYTLEHAKANAKMRDDDAKAALKSQDELLKKQTDGYKQYTREVGQLFTSFFESILDGGTNSFGKLVDNIRNLFVKMMAQLAAMKLGQFVVENALTPTIAGISSSVYSPEMIAKAGGGTPQSGALAGALGYGGVALGAGLVGFGVGGQAGSYGGAALGGALSGAATGAAIGSIVPVVGTAVGAVVGAVAGLVGGLFGQADKIKKARDQFNQDQAKFIDSLTKSPNQTIAAFQQIEDAFKTLRDEASKAKTSVSVQAIQAKNAAEAQIKSDFTDSLTQQLNTLNGAQGTYLNDVAAIEKAYTDNVATVQALGLGEDQLTQAEQLRTQQLAQLKAATDAANKADSDNLTLRQLQAKGDVAGTRALQEQMEVDAAAAAGKSALYIAELKETQAIEDQAAATQAATDAALAAAAAAEKAQQTYEALTVRYLSALGLTQQASDAAFAAQQRQELAAAKSDSSSTPQSIAEVQVVQLLERGLYSAEQAAAKQLTVAQAQLTANQSQLQVAQSQLTALTNAKNSVTGYAASLGLSSNTILSPKEQEDLARQQLNATFAKAMAGDTTAAGNFQNQADTLLGISRNNNASDPAYAADFQNVQSMANQLASFYTDQTSLQQQMVDALQKQIDLLTAEIAALQDGNNIARSAKDATIKELQDIADASAHAGSATLDQYRQLIASVTGAGAAVVAAEYQTLQANATAVQTATQNEINAINNGASLQQVAQLEQIRQIELAKAAYDTASANQIAALAQQLGWDSPVVKKLIDAQTQYDIDAQNQINAINGTTSAVNGLGGLIGKAPGGIPVDTPPGTGPIHTTPGTQPVGGTQQVTTTFFSVSDPYLGYSITLPTGTTTYTDILGDQWTAPNTWVAANGDNRLVPGLATGGIFSAGDFHLVGEEGPELAQFGSGGQLFNAAETAQILNGSSAGGSYTELVDGIHAAVKILQGIQADARKTGTATDTRLARLEKSFATVAVQGLFNDRNSGA
jgi:uncharacterized membrane protein